MLLKHYLMTPNEITTLLAMDLGKELDVPFKKAMYERVKYWRATLIRQTLQAHPNEARYFLQTIYIPLVRTNTLQVVDPRLSDFAAVTAIEVPLPIRASATSIFHYVGGVDGKSPWGFADAGTLDYLRSGQYAKLFNWQNYVNRKFAVYEWPDLEYIRIGGIFNSPEEAMVYESIPPQPNYNWWDTDIPMSGDVEQRVIQCILTTDYGKASREKDKTDDHQVQVNNEQQ